MQAAARNPSRGPPSGRSKGGGAGGSDPAAMKKRSVVIAGHRTSVSLENAFWQVLKTIAAGTGRTVNQMVTDIDRDRTGNLSSAIRVHVLLAVRPG